MEGTILNRRELDQTFADEIKTAIFQEDYVNLPSFDFVNDNALLKKHGITFDSTKKIYIPTPRHDGGDLVIPFAIKEDSNLNNDGSAGGIASITEIFETNISQMNTAATKMQRKKKATNITFLRDKGDCITCRLSLMATKIEACANSLEIINHCNNGYTDKERVFTMSDSDNDAIFTKKTRTVIFEFVDLNTSLYLDQFKKTPTVVRF